MGGRSRAFKAGKRHLTGKHGAEIVRAHTEHMHLPHPINRMARPQARRESIL
jgi:hypothetical protein